MAGEEELAVSKGVVMAAVVAVIAVVAILEVCIDVFIGHASIGLS